MALKFQIPGQEILLNDGNLLVQSANPNAKIGILGTAQKGPQGLRAVPDTQTASALYGETSELTRKVAEAFSGFGPAANVYAYRIGGRGMIFEYTYHAVLPASLQPIAMDGLFNDTGREGKGFPDPITGSLNISEIAALSSIGELPSTLSLQDMHAAVGVWKRGVAAGTEAGGAFTLPSNKSLNTDIHIYRITDAGFGGLALSPGAAVTTTDNGYDFDLAMTWLGEDAANHTGAPNSGGYLGTLAAAITGLWVTGVTVDGDGFTTGFSANDPTVLGGAEWHVLVFYYNIDSGLTEADGFQKSTLVDTNTGYTYTAWYYTGSEAWNSFKGFKMPVTEVNAGLRIQSEEANDGMEDEISLYFDPVSGTVKVYDTDTSAILYSNVVGQEIDKGLVVVTTEGDLTLLNPINEGTVLSAEGLGDPLPANAGPPAAATTVQTTITSVLALPNYYSGVNLLQASGSEQFLTKRQRYEYLDKAYDNLLYYDLDIVVPVNVFIDDPNVAYYADTVLDYKHDPTSDNTLTWLKTVKGVGVIDHYWSPDEDFNATWTDASLRLADEYHEVNFIYQLARFCETSTQNGRVCQGVISANKPKSTKLADLLEWVGDNPKYAGNGTMIAAGTGLLGNPWTIGTTADELHILTRERDPVIGTTTGERVPGLFLTDSTELDGNTAYDKNNKPIDMGKFISQMIDWPVFAAPGRRFGITDDISAYFAGFMVALDPKVSPTSKATRSLQSVWQPGFKIEEALVAAKYVILSNRAGRTVFVDSITMATDASDWTDSLTTRIVKLITDSLAAIGRDIEGEVLSQAEKVAFSKRVEENLMKFKKGQYLNSFQYNITQTRVQGKLGDITVSLALGVPREVKQVNWIVNLTA